MRTLEHKDYTVAWICALPETELSASLAVFDERHTDLRRDPDDTNTYNLGRIGKHNVAMLCLPVGRKGAIPAALAAERMRSTFRHIKFGLVVGIGGGVPSDENDIRLGDVVVGKPNGKSPGVVQWDFGKTGSGGNFVHKGRLDMPPDIVLTALSKLLGDKKLENSLFLQHLPEKGHCPAPGQDTLFLPDYDHVGGDTCADCDRTKLVPPRTPRPPKVHYGTIASGNRLMEHGLTRNRIAEVHKALCFEMEGAAIVSTLPSLVIRGISDYSDSHKNGNWKPYASATAAAYAKAFLSVVPEDQVATTPAGFIKPEDTPITAKNSQDFAAEPTPSSRPQSQDSFFVVNRQIFESNTVALGRLVINIRAPWEDYCPYTKAPDKKDIGITVKPRVQEIIEATRGMAVHESFIKMLFRLLEDEDVIRAINSISCAEKTYVLPNPCVLFQEICKDTKVREWFSNFIRYGVETYMIVGLHTLSSPVTRRMKPNDQVTSHLATEATGEAIIAIQYRKVRYHWFWRSVVDKAFLDRSDVWEPAFITKGSTTEDSEIVHATLKDVITTSDVPDEGEVIVIDGQVIVLELSD